MILPIIRRLVIVIVCLVVAFCLIFDLLRGVRFCCLLFGRKEEIQREIENQQALGAQDLQEEDQYLLEVNLEDLETSSGERQEYWLLAIQAARRACLIAREDMEIGDSDEDSTDSSSIEEGR